MDESKLSVPQNGNIAKFVFFGDPLLNISAKCDAETLIEFGLKPDDCIKATEEHSALFEGLSQNPNVRFTVGGSAQNSARIAKWILGDRADVCFAGSVGKDDYSKLMSEKLQNEGVKPLYVYHEDQATGVCACLSISERERSMCTRHGAASCFSQSDVSNPDILRQTKTANCIFVVGYFLAHSPDAVSTFSETCSPNQIFSLSLSAEYVCKYHTQALCKILPRIDILLGNEAEITAFFKALGTGEISAECIENVAHHIAGLNRPPSCGYRIVVVTRGAKPVIVAESGNKPPRSFEVPGNVEVVDSVGCGDAFAGGFLGAYTVTRDVSTAVQVGIRAAAIIAQTHCCDPSPDKIDEMKSLMC